MLALPSPFLSAYIPPCLSAAKSAAWLSASGSTPSPRRARAAHNLQNIRAAPGGNFGRCLLFQNSMFENATAAPIKLCTCYLLLRTNHPTTWWSRTTAHLSGHNSWGSWGGRATAGLAGLCPCVVLADQLGTGSSLAPGSCLGLSARAPCFSSRGLVSSNRLDGALFQAGGNIPKGQEQKLQGLRSHAAWCSLCPVGQSHSRGPSRFQRRGNRLHVLVGGAAKNL